MMRPYEGRSKGSIVAEVNVGDAPSSKSSSTLRLAVEVPSIRGVVASASLRGGGKKRGGEGKQEISNSGSKEDKYPPNLLNW
ncbi:hypothetical protein XELAEV_18009387mg [Xenopus laevis]|uniref:Uncharacterized protein n=1 Tax=Xenopus laevis TaxID=8355 RepID=A0A974DSF8_XENLA|nr:hypothetical protein XELAEV_18009387mg [Xenopus laevis]